MSSRHGLQALPPRPGTKSSPLSHLSVRSTLHFQMLFERVRVRVREEGRKEEG